MSKTILVTGANRGIGLELVRQYAIAGCNVLACCRDPGSASELQKTQQTNKNISIYQLDVTNENHIKEIAKKLKNFPIDILFNNAGVAGKDNLFGSISYEDLISTFKVNTVAPVMIAQALINQINQGKNKLIVNTSSTLASIELNDGSDWAWVSYRISKSALNAATKSLANLLKPKKITVIALDPGWVQTDMGGKDADLTPEESVKGIRKVVENISLEDSGKFIRYNGQSVPW